MVIFCKIKNYNKNVLKFKKLKFLNVFTIDPIWMILYVHFSIHMCCNNNQLYSINDVKKTFLNLLSVHFVFYSITLITFY